DETHFGASGRFSVGAHVVAEAIRQRAGRELRVDGHQLGQAVGGDRSGGRVVPWSRGLGRSRETRGDQETSNEAADGNAESEESHVSILPRRSAADNPLDSRPSPSRRAQGWLRGLVR